MNPEEKIEILKHIKLGTKEVLYYPYNEGKEPLPLRPISSYEMDQSFLESLLDAPEKIASLVIKLKLNLVKPEDEIKVSNDGYAKLLNYYNSVDYWVVYHAMKDFQEEWFKEPDYDKPKYYPKGFYKIREMDEVHDIADYIIGDSYKTETVIKEIFTDAIGREVAMFVVYLNQPISEIGQMTKLQRDYLIYASGNLRKILKGEAINDKYSKTGEVMTVKELIEQFGVDLK